jgi:hypothetical protein
VHVAEQASNWRSQAMEDTYRSNSPGHGAAIGLEQSSPMFRRSVRARK